MTDEVARHLFLHTVHFSAIAVLRSCGVVMLIWAYVGALSTCLAYVGHVAAVVYGWVASGPRVVPFPCCAHRAAERGWSEVLFKKSLHDDRKVLQVFSNRGTRWGRWKRQKAARLWTSACVSGRKGKRYNLRDLERQLQLVLQPANTKFVAVRPYCPSGHVGGVAVACRICAKNRYILGLARWIAWLPMLNRSAADHEWAHVIQELVGRSLTYECHLGPRGGFRFWVHLLLCEIHATLWGGPLFAGCAATVYAAILIFAVQRGLYAGLL